jgi:hypothetical protein
MRTRGSPRYADIYSGFLIAGPDRRETRWKPLPSQELMTMSTITTRDGADIYYKDWGSGQPVVFSHGWPLSADAWDAQMVFLGERGYRVIAHDRRGHGCR